VEPSVSVIVAAYNEESVIERRVDNLLALDYPSDRLEIVVASDASSDRTNELVEAVAAREPRIRLLDCPRGWQGRGAGPGRARDLERGRRLLRR
jgi:cellulose synthase/poly-beta-1,6-N-acetylglucosamine synthase-like glycosyltransferase